MHVSFQLSILKTLAGQPHGRRVSKSLGSIGYRYSSGREWPARMKRIAGRGPNSVSSAEADAEVGCWIVTEEGREYLETLDQLDRYAVVG
ncbi:hypothetical protein ABIA06_003027 [Bradyrhizobium yuanmingense]